MNTTQSTSGVQGLIDRLREQGVAEGHRQAADLLEEARSRATHMIEQATAKSDSMRKEAEQESRQMQQAAQAALGLALRDTTLKLREEIYGKFAAELKRIVEREIADPSLIRQTVEDIVRQAVPGGATAGLKIVLPASVATAEDLRKNPQELEQGSLSQWAATLAQEALSKGIDLLPATDSSPGIRVELAGGDVRIDATDQAITQLLLKHLMPRFRALMEGTV